MFTLIQMEQLLRIAETGTISSAAEILSISQPALSRSMQALEQELGVSLFERKKNKVTLSETGKKAVEYAGRIFDEAQRLEERLREYDRQLHTVTAASNAPAGLWNLQYLLAPYCPGMEIRTVFSDESVTDGMLLEALDKDIYAMIVTAEKPSSGQYLIRKLCVEHICIAFPEKKLPKEYKKGCYLSDVDGKTFLTMSGSGRWSSILKERMPLSSFIYLDDPGLIKDLANSSPLPVFTSDLALQYFGSLKGRTAVPLFDGDMTVEYYCVTKKNVREEVRKFMSA